MFDAATRDRVRDWVVERARGDSRIAAGAVIGSAVTGAADRYSDLDLTFAVHEGVDRAAVLDDYTSALHDAFAAVMLFDLPWQGIVYRVFLLPDCLQVDLSFARGAVVQSSPRFELLWGEKAEVPAEPTPAEELFGYAALFVRSARVTIERGRPWQAEYCIGEVRNNGMALACRRRGLVSSYGKGLDQLPAEVRDRFEGTLVRSLEREELERALEQATECLLAEAEEVRELAASVGAQLRALAARVHG